MKIKTNPSFLLFIEPVGPASEPIIDIYTQKMIGAFRNAVEGVSNYSHPDKEPWFEPGSGYRGFHFCECGTSRTSSCDFLIPTTESIFVYHNKENCPVQAIITNNLCLHYVACHREEVPFGMLQQILFLVGEPAQPTEEEMKLIFSPRKS